MSVFTLKQTSFIYTVPLLLPTWFVKVLLGVQCLRTCRDKWSERLKERVQSWQRKGFTPVCLR